MIALTSRPLEADAFAPFGTVIAFESAAARLVNEGTALRADACALFEYASGTEPVLALYRATPKTLPLRLTLFERHPLSAQTFVSLSVPRFLVVVAPRGADGLPVAAAAQVFVGLAGMGVSYRSNQWHMPIMALGTGGDLLMLMAEHGTTEDCIEHRLAVPLLIQDDVSSERTPYGA
ncbi:ureidoglycolate lyase [Lichenifustis flavocetrariae]|uniref:Ureidoglycolate lyase n=1 Tax=Lichenifustis flavocetrariae TaxID=2949735 RepID=A0AA42CIX6_9HYPH|nr:ureidoglycolate lyase [Lichenifustis flavocetrariae]MCW6508854.1 ureidoglycolate lyase [Lichenifustis flavocetrariae]